MFIGTHIVNKMQCLFLDIMYKLNDSAFFGQPICSRWTMKMCPSIALALDINVNLSEDDKEDIEHSKVQHDTDR